MPKIKLKKPTTLSIAGPTKICRVLRSFTARAHSFERNSCRVKNDLCSVLKHVVAGVPNLCCRDLKEKIVAGVLIFFLQGFKKPLLQGF